MKPQKSSFFFNYFNFFYYSSKLLTFSSLRKIYPAGFLQILDNQELRTRPLVVHPERRCPGRGLGSLPRRECYMCPILLLQLPDSTLIYKGRIKHYNCNIATTIKHMLMVELESDVVTVGE